MTTNDHDINAALKSWRDELMGVTRQSALMQFREAKTSSLNIAEPMPDALLGTLRSGALIGIRGEQNDVDSATRQTEISAATLLIRRPDSEVGRVARTMQRRSQAELLERGLAVLYIAVGILAWRDIDDKQMRSPLLLVPVELVPEGPKSTPRMRIAEDPPVLNPALMLRLQEFGVQAPVLDDIEDLSARRVLGEVESSLSAAADFQGWKIEESTHLGLFSFAKEVMYRDLLDNAETIVESGIARALATSDPVDQTDQFDFEQIGLDAIDNVAAPEATPLVLDADSSQRVAIAAAIAGKSFVMDGPPGTGKSQTIANMIAALLHAGKTVLFVSEKMAALDVVRNRLTDVGLGSYLLELHSHKANRREVATQLLTSLDNVPRPPSAMSALVRGDIADRRRRLNEYAEAMNEVRTPLNRTLHQVVGDYSALNGVDQAPLPSSSADISEADELAIKGALGDLERAWRPAVEAGSFLWRDAVDERSLDVRLHQTLEALGRLREAATPHRTVMRAFTWKRQSEIPTLAELLAQHHQHRPDDVMQRWLTEPSFELVRAQRDKLNLHVAVARQSERDVVDAAGVPVSALPSASTLPGLPAPPATNPASIDISAVRLSSLTVASKQLDSDSSMLSTQLQTLTSLSTAIGVPLGSTFADVDRFSRIIEIKSSGLPFDARWFTLVGLENARAALGRLNSAALSLAQAESKAATTFSPQALTAPLSELKDRFDNLHRGLRKLSGGYRADKKQLSGLLTEAATVKAGINGLAEAVSWANAGQQFDQAAATEGHLLGRLWHGRGTDFNAAEQALSAAGEIIGLCQGHVPEGTIRYLSTTDSSTHHAEIARGVHDRIGTWKASLLPAPAVAGPPELLLLSVPEAVTWLQAQHHQMDVAIDYIQHLTSATGRDLTFKEATAIMHLAEEARRAANDLQAEGPEHRAWFGPHFKGGETDLDQLDVAITWSAAIREIVGTAFTEEQVHCLDHSLPPGDLSSVHSAWVSRATGIVEAFAQNRHQELWDEIDGFDEAREFLSVLLHDSVGQSEWFSFISARAKLQAQGLATAIDYCIEKRVKSETITPIVLHALYREWIDDVVGADSRLRPLGQADRDSLVGEYRDLDRQLFGAAVADIINAVNSRRPANTTMGESALIRREGMKKQRHRPVRELMAKTKSVTQSIKPVFMMSPLAVSQYLPPSMRFDVVIFDEASQVTPGDAVNCIYRGESLILAGDDKQLPPTSFFQRANEDDSEDTDVNDFQSVLELAKASGAFQNLGLRWHYRSRHEDLIAFSNYKFYEGKLVTFPSAQEHGRDIGVEFINAGGIYRRGGGSTNPVEAAAVAQRVIDHYTTHPELTVGVVTFSVAQANAVNDALDEARRDRRDLDRFFDTDDRLGGFFVRALEQVQGDERDVIIFSVGYGPDEAGKISTNFGALNRDKGWRRLNVGITRARQRVEVVASMHARDIPPSSNENVEYLRAYLDFAEKGTSTLAIPYSSTGLDPESPFEESVLNVVRGWGYTVEPQVGAAGYRIDMAVRHPEYQGMFVLGIECDGYQYHSSPSARDRDRLRDQVLVGLGWTLHRIWGTAWYRDRESEEIRLRKAIATAVAAPIRAPGATATSYERPVVELTLHINMEEPTWTTPYSRCPEMPVPHWLDLGGAGSHAHMIGPIQNLVAHEGPVHISVVHDRVRSWWNVSRVGKNIKANIDRSIALAEVERDGDFLTVPGYAVHQVRTPADGVERTVDTISLVEIALAVVMTVRDAGAVQRDEVVVAVARLFGQHRTGRHITERINEAINVSLGDQDLAEANDGTLTLA